MRVAYRDLHNLLTRVLITHGLEPERASLCARLFADASRDGVSTHGVNRFPRFVRMIRTGVVDVAASPVRVSSRGALEQWDGRRGPGNLNAWQCMDTAIALSRTFGIGCVALANTNHWMRGGAYGWQAADAGAIGICWTNTMPNMPPWGASESRLGNNPIVIAVPRPEGHVVLDMAMSQFSYGALEAYRTRGEMLPVPGGFDAAGELSRDAAAIEEANRPLPVGFWKGSGLALLLDLVGASLSGGRATCDVPPDSEQETGLSQVFVAFDVSSPASRDAMRPVVERVIADLLDVPAAGDRVRYPGQRTLETRRRNLAEGIPVDPSVWKTVQEIEQS
jgi:3-dehydro-L-gulonate 2-dehydrogenase